MLRALSPFILLTLSVFAYEDVSFSARTLGMGGVQTILSGDVMASTAANPALSARLRRGQIVLSGAVYQSNINWTTGFSIPVKSKGNVGGTLLYFPDVNESDLRLFWAIPLGQFFNLGAGIGNHSSNYQYYPFSRSGNLAYQNRNEEGSFFSVGLSCSAPKGFNFGVAIRDAGFNLKFAPPTTVNVGFGWGAEFLSTPLLSSVLLVTEGRFITDGSIEFSIGAEGFMFDETFGLRAGLNYDQDGISPALGASLRTHRIEKTDFKLHYGLSVISSLDSASTLHQLSVNVLFGDARKAEKDSIIAAQTERARKLKEQTLAREIEELQEQIEILSEERSALERERADIERLRAEALFGLERIGGVNVIDDSATIRINLTETAVKFEPGSAEIPYPAGYRTLDKVAGFFSHYPTAVILIRCHTDNLPVSEEFTDKYSNNTALSRARANAIKGYLVDVKGISSARIKTEGVGDSEPVQDNETAEGRAANRRVELLVTE